MVFEALTGPDVAVGVMFGLVIYFGVTALSAKAKVNEISLANQVANMISQALGEFAQAQTDKKQSEAILKNEIELGKKANKP